MVKIKGVYINCSTPIIKEIVFLFFIKTILYFTHNINYIKLNLIIYIYIKSHCLIFMKIQSIG
jgi:hypothetical protein